MADPSYPPMVLERDDQEHPVPIPLRDRIRSIVDAFMEGDLSLERHPIKGVAGIDAQTAGHIAGNIADYGDTLATLDEATWGRSCYRWMDGYWEILVDLTTSREAVSDLTLHMKVRDGSRRIEICSVHTP